MEGSIPLEELSAKLLLPFLAVGRVQDAVTLAWYESTDSFAMPARGVWNKMLAAAAHKLCAGQRTRLGWKSGSICCLMNQEGTQLYCVFTESRSYPEKLAYQLLHDFVAIVALEGDIASAPENGLNDKLQGQMVDLVKRYQDPNTVGVLFHGHTFEILPPAFVSMDRVNADKEAKLVARIRICFAVFLFLVVFGLVYWFGFRDTGGDTSLEQVSFARDTTRPALADMPGVSPSLATITMV